ncbi:GroES-like protein [Stemphylium lycopersici]|uniref:GroES-like protein n=1 Tax=Stemphylium lycopersici TaxID=183478 RepID=A0A364MYX4_STELY|nr:GroES-like protein [Stemphylium lycopersici]
MVVYSGLKAINLKPGERIVVTPATGRNEHALARLVSAHPRVVSMTVRTNDVDKDTENLQQYGVVDGVLDMTPMGAEGSTHVRAASGALEQYGRACMMGMGVGAMKDIEIPVMQMTFRSITVHGHAMYLGEDVRDIIKTAEASVLKLGKHRGVDTVAEFKLDNFKKGFDWVAKNHEFGQMAVLVP